MKLKTFFTIKAVITAVFALLLLLFPANMWGIFGVDMPSEGVIFAHYIGASFIAISLVCWLNRNAPVAAQKNATLTLAVTDTIGFIVSLFAQLRGIPNAWGWVTMLLWLVLAAGNIYYTWFNQVVFDSVEAV